MNCPCIFSNKACSKSMERRKVASVTNHVNQYRGLY